MLVIFIDALPYESAKKFTSLQKYNLAQLTPGYGYSVNLHAELFAGVTPDIAGYFGDMAYSGKPVRLNAFLTLIAKLEFRWYRLSRLVRLVLNILTKRRIGYIPLAFKGLFNKKGVYTLVKKPCFKTIFDSVNFSTHIADKVKAGVGKKDIVVLESAIKALDAGEKDIFISLCDLDGMYHDFGEQHEKVLGKLSQLDSILDELLENYRQNHPEENVFVISDHGISNADKHVTFNYRDFEEEIFNGELVVFFDSLYLSYWTDNQKVKSRLENMLSSLPGNILSESQRREAGVLDSRFGDGIFLLNEGHGFCPNFFGFRPLKAYHGYEPQLKKSRGVLATNVMINSNLKNIDVFNILNSSI